MCFCVLSFTHLSHCRLVAFACSMSQPLSFSDSEDYFSGSDDDWCHEVDLGPNAKRARVDTSDSDVNDAAVPLQQGGSVVHSATVSPLFEVTMSRVGPRQGWRNVVHKQRYRLQWQQQRDPTSSDDLGAEVVAALHRALVTLTSDRPTTDTLHFALQSQHFTHAFQSAIFRVGELTNTETQRLATYLDTLAAKLNSNQAFDVDDSFDVDVTLMNNPGPGSGNGKRYRPSKAAARKLQKRTMINIKNTDDLCCARAIVTMKAWSDEKHSIFPESSYVSLRQGLPCQERLAKALHRQAGVPEGPCGIPELLCFQAAMPEYQIVVMAIDPPHMILYKGPEARQKILLVKVDEHYHGCTSFAGFLSKSYFCFDCDRGYDHDDHAHHPCQGRFCSACHTKTCPDFLTFKQTLPSGQFLKPTLECDICHRSFFGPTCRTTHREGNPSMCQSLKKCLQCSKVEERKFKGGRPDGPRHKCGWGDCPHCKKRVHLASHKCYIQPVAEEDDLPKTKKVPATSVGTRPVVSEEPDANGMVEVEREPSLFVFADYEAMVDDKGIQSPVLLCYETSESDTVVPHYGSDCTSRFLEDLNALAVDQDGDDRRVIILFHNLKGYDAMFLLQQMYADHREVTDQITVGAKVLSFKSDLLTFKDSLCFLPFPLASFPATFGCMELCKGYFPHRFNTLANQGYEGPLPNASYYDPDGMNEKKKRDFEQWYATQAANHYEFNLQRDMRKYCESDVKLLKAGCTKFSRDFEAEAGFNPLEKCITIASSCNLYWRKNLGVATDIAVEPSQGWKGVQTNQSFKARQWLAWQEALLRRATSSDATPFTDRIRHVDNEGEVRVAGHLVDGFDASTNTVYEFHGCLWHGCPRCFHRKRDLRTKWHPDRTLQEMYDHTQVKHDQIRAQGYGLVYIWECDWNRQVQTQADLKTFLSSLEWTTPLQPRDAFFGGRTNAVKLHHHVDESQGERISYLDVTSLYPWVNKTSIYPVGHPTVVTRPGHTDISQYFGLAKVTVLPPFGLYHPVLPYRQGGKLTFPLCKSCVKEEMAKPMLERSATCHHASSDRALTGTWCTPELEKAVELGYKIQTIHEVWHFPPRQMRVGLFKQYVNTWLKIKQEASGYPAWANADDKKTQYVREYDQHEGIRLDPAKIAKNPGKRSLAKLMLNSFWGKFGENLFKNTTEVVHTPAHLFELVSHPLKDIKQVRICNEETLEVVYSALEDNVEDNGRVNIFVAAFTTCHARLKLYSYLEQLGERTLYFDTDSVLFTSRPGDGEIVTGDYLGDMTDELGDGDHIVDFTTGGPKNYGYRTANGKVECKVRGFTLNVRGSHQLNYDILRQNVLDELTAPRDQRRIVPVVNPHFFTRDPSTKQLKVIPRTKGYGLVFDKRVVNPVTFQSFPYGCFRTDPVNVENIDTLMELLTVI